jgi:hypothetical protein
MSDHGFITGTRPGTETISGVHFDAGPPGVLAMAGGGLPAGESIAQASVLDITPMVLHLMGLPVARDMAGSVPPVVVTASGDRLVEFVDSYEASPGVGEEPVVTEHDEAIIARLKALGYL